MQTSIPPAKLDINPLFAKALDLMENSDKHIFVTGRAGTGKSTLLDYFRSITEKEIIVLAPTGVAAVNIGGATIHSFFKFKPDVTTAQIRRDAKKRKNDYSIYKYLDAIIIDEISMVRADLLDCVDEFLRLHGRSANMPFGGIQMIFIGDLYQLPPVVVGKEREIFTQHYASEYFFDSYVFSRIDFEYLELEKIYRQTDAAFINLLNGIRNKTITAEQIEEFNRRCIGDDATLPDDAIFLTTTNKMADERNEAKLDALRGREFTTAAKVKGRFDEKYFPAERMLTLKKNAQIMLLNNDAEGRWINGTIGIVHRISEDRLFVKLADGCLEEVEPFTWKIYEFSWNKKSKSVDSEAIGSFTQYPVRLAWAITIHKSQGKTFDKAAIDFGRGTFSPGQAYVALSRCRSLDGLWLKRALRLSDVWRDWRVTKFVTEQKYQKSEALMPLEDKVAMIAEAIVAKSSLEITYLKADDEKSRRIIKPLSIGEMEFKGKPFLGLTAFCDTRREQRTFRVDRILEMKQAKT